MNGYGNKNSNYRHGHNSKTAISPTYFSWSAMKSRCVSNHESQIRYKNISVCKRWEKFENFLEDMGERPKGLTLDRIDNNKGYSKENCRWATLAEQQRNRTDSTILEYKGKRKHIIEWAKELGTTTIVLRARLRRGWTVERTINTKVRKYGI